MLLLTDGLMQDLAVAATTPPSVKFGWFLSEKSASLDDEGGSVALVGLVGGCSDIGGCGGNGGDGVSVGAVCRGGGEGGSGGLSEVFGGDLGSGG